MLDLPASDTSLIRQKGPVKWRVSPDTSYRFSNNWGTNLTLAKGRLQFRLRQSIITIMS